MMLLPSECLPRNYALQTPESSELLCVVGGLKIFRHSFYKDLLSTYYVPDGAVGNTDDRLGASLMELPSHDDPHSASHGWSLAKLFKPSLIRDDNIVGTCHCSFPLFPETSA